MPSLVRAEMVTASGICEPLLVFDFIPARVSDTILISEWAPER